MSTEVHGHDNAGQARISEDDPRVSELLDLYSQGADGRLQDYRAVWVRRDNGFQSERGRQNLQTSRLDEYVAWVSARYCLLAVISRR